jgi:hypothetical protein
MDTEPLCLYIDGGRHLTRPEKRIEAIENTPDEVDIVFVEAPRNSSPGRHTVVMNFFAVPVLVVTVYLYVLLLRSVGKLTASGDEDIVQHFEETHNAEVIPTDVGFHQLLRDSRGLWFLGHTVVVLFASLALPNFVEMFSWGPVLFRLFTLFILTGLGVFVLFLAGTLHARNLQMVRDIEQRATVSSGENACLVTGSYHVPGVRDALEESELVELAEQ